MKTISVKLPDDLLADLESEAKARRLTKSVLVRESIETALRRPPRRSDATCYDLSRDLAGRANCVGFYRGELERQCNLLRSIWKAPAIINANPIRGTVCGIIQFIAPNAAITNRQAACSRKLR